jgi:hypothetical protein
MFIVCYVTEFRSESWCFRKCSTIKGHTKISWILSVAKSALKYLILWWVVVYDKYKTALVSDPRHRIALVDILHVLQPESTRPPVSAFKAEENQLVWSGGSDQTLVRLSYYPLRLQQSDGCIYLRVGNIDWFRQTEFWEFICRLKTEQDIDVNLILETQGFQWHCMEAWPTTHLYGRPDMKLGPRHTSMGGLTWSLAHDAPLWEARHEAWPTTHLYGRPDMKLGPRHTSMGGPTWSLAHDTPLWEARHEAWPTTHLYGRPDMKLGPRHTSMGGLTLNI